MSVGRDESFLDLIFCKCAKVIIDLRGSVVASIHPSVHKVKVRRWTVDVWAKCHTASDLRRCAPHQLHATRDKTRSGARISDISSYISYIIIVVYRLQYRICM